MSKTAIIVLITLVVGVLAGFGFFNIQRNIKLQEDARVHGRDVVQYVLQRENDRAYATAVYEEIFSDAYKAAFNGGLFTCAMYDERIFMREIAHRINDRATQDRRPEVAEVILILKNR